MSQTREMSKISGDSSLGLGLSRYIDDFFRLMLQVDIGVKQSWITIPSPSLSGSVNSGKLLDVSEPDFLYL